MKRKDFSRKANSYAPVLMNDSYASFRFSKRGTEVLSPLAKTKLNFSGKHDRKMSLMSNTVAMRSENVSFRGVSMGGQGGSETVKISNTENGGFAGFGSKKTRHQSLADSAPKRQMVQSRDGNTLFNNVQRRTSVPQ